MSKTILTEGKTIEVLVVAMAAIQFLWFLVGFFIKSYFNSLKNDVNKLFELLEKKDLQCISHAEKIGRLLGKLNGNK